MIENVVNIYERFLCLFFKDLPEVEEGMYLLRRHIYPHRYEEEDVMMVNYLIREIGRAEGRSNFNAEAWLWMENMLSLHNKLRDRILAVLLKQTTEIDQSYPILIDRELYAEYQEIMKEARTLICKYGG